MARTKTTRPTPGPPQVSPEQGIALIEKQIKKARELLRVGVLRSDDYSAWKLLTLNVLTKAFGANSPNVSSVMGVGEYGTFPVIAGEAWWASHRRESLQTQIKQMQGLIELLQTELQLKQGTGPHAAPEPHGHRVFLVHGHDERALHETARFLEGLDQHVVVLREQPNRGRTIIEKFEDHADVGFAVVLLTGDDRGGPIDARYEEQSRRARQNVVFELGYFIGRLGRKRVCALYAPDVEILSDYAGVLYIQLDKQGAWRLALAKELKVAGFPVDMNLAL